MTLEGIIYKADRTPYTGTFQLRLSESPGDGESGTTIGLPLTVACDGANPDPVGEYSTSLRAGYYAVDIPGTARFFITAPSGSDTYALEELTDVVIGSAPQTVFDSWTEVSAVTIRALYEIINVRSDFNGQKATFWRIDGTATGLEGVDYVQDAAGTYFERET
jgi:hypothetical protein